MAARRPVPSRYASLKADGASGILNPPLPPTPTNQIRSELAYVSSPIPSPAPRRELGRHEAPPNAITSTIMGPNFAGRGVYQEKLLPNPGYAPSIRSIETTSSSYSLPYPRDTSDRWMMSDLDLSETELLMSNNREDDDELHEPSARDLESGRGTIFTGRGLANLGFLVFLLLGLVFLFAGFPVLVHFRNQASLNNQGAHGIGGVNASGQVPEIANFFALIDPDTPSEALYHTSLETQAQWELVFSDEFNRDNRTFYPGDDPYWEAVDLHYYPTNDLEYYDPSAITTKDGYLQIIMTRQESHGLQYQSGMLQSWNQFCFTGGYIEVSVSLPGFSSISGLWPAVWTMGNLGRAGYGSTTDGTWPYSYEACDVGTLANQTLNDFPAGISTSGADGGPLSFLPGQRLSSCTCPGEHHPGPTNPDGTFVGRSAPEIDVLEAIINGDIGQVSQSAQTAPFDLGYNWANGSTDATVLTPSLGGINSFRGSVFQESVSGLFDTNQAAYSGNALLSGSTPTFATYGFEYKPGYDADGGYITWVNNGVPSWSIGASAVGANTAANISARPIPKEPMYLLANLGMSTSFGEQSEFLSFPAIMFIDYIRVYQDPNAKNIGCSPKDFPTEDYINSLPDLYGNYNLTTFEQAGQTFPKSTLLGQC